MMSGRAISANRGSTVSRPGSNEHSEAGRDEFAGGERARGPKLEAPLWLGAHKPNGWPDHDTLSGHLSRNGAVPHARFGASLFMSGAAKNTKAKATQPTVVPFVLAAVQNSPVQSS